MSSDVHAGLLALLAGDPQLIRRLLHVCSVTATVLRAGHQREGDSLTPQERLSSYCVPGSGGRAAASR